VGEIHISAEQEVQKWRSLYKNLKSKKKAKLEQSWQELTNVYDKNHTQMNVFMDEIEIAVHELTHAREKMNIKHLGTMTNVEQEMERLCELALKSSRSQQSMQSQATASK
jgi:mevalonate kinase